MTTDGNELASALRMDPQLAEECANWTAEQLSGEFGGFVAAEVIDAILDFEVDIRVEHNDPEMDHRTMAGLLLEKLRDEGAPVESEWGITPQLLNEILHWEDEFRGFAGIPRAVRPSA